MSVTIRKLAAALAFACALVAAGPARAWNAGTHAWIASEMHKKAGLADPAVLLDRIYGANAIDIFNNDFVEPHLTLQAWLHESPPDALFLEVWKAADPQSPREVALAYGVVTHNNAWGADSTAHVAGITSGRDRGWVIVRAESLGQFLGPILQGYGLDLPPAVLTDVGHVLVETAVDLLVKERLDPAVGEKVLASAQARDPETWKLLARAWADDFAGTFGGPEAAAGVIQEKEAELQAFLWWYGASLAADDALIQVSVVTAWVAARYLDALGLPPIPTEQLVGLVVFGVDAAMDLCRADFRRELAATVGWVNGRMSSNGVAF
jgi:hypothetical protein